MPDNPITIMDTPDDIARAVTGRVRTSLQAAHERHRRASLGFAWDPHTARILAALARFGGVSWDLVDIFFAHDHAPREGGPDTIYHAACAQALDHIPLDPDHIWRMPADATNREEAAHSYGAHLAAGLDLLLLGVGPRGEVVGCGVNAPTRVVATEHGLQITEAVIREARSVLVVAFGSDSADGVVQALGHEVLSDSAWFLDMDAASRLER